METLFSLLGYVGVVFLLLAYLMVTTGQMKTTDTHHIMMNLLGALFIVIAVHTGSTVPFMPTIVLWFVISLFGLYKHRLTTTR